ncbi:MAG TPA: hypothetical protein VGD37_14965 [Kofleriaceae bacterium]|jgi:hypothetical protein
MVVVERLGEPREAALGSALELEAVRRNPDVLLEARSDRLLLGGGPLRVANLARNLAYQGPVIALAAVAAVPFATGSTCSAGCALEASRTTYRISAFVAEGNMALWCGTNPVAAGTGR